MEPTFFNQILNTTTAEDIALVLAIIVTFAIALIPAIITLTAARNRSTKFVKPTGTETELLYTVYRDRDGEVKVWRH